MGFKTALEDSYLYWILVEKGSYTKAGLHLGIPKSQISRRIVELERRLRKVLLFRNTRKIYLTEFGIFYFNSIDSVMREWGNIQDKFQNESDSILPIRIAVPSGIASYFLPLVLNRYWKKFPNQKIELFENKNIYNLLEERLDLSIRLEDKLQPGTSRTKLGCLKINLYASIKLKNKLSKKDIESGKINTVSYHLSDYLKEKVSKNHLFKKILELPYRVKVSEFSTALQFCILGEGLLAMPDFIAEESVSKGILFNPFPEDYLNFGPVEMISLENRFTSKPLLQLMKEVEEFSKEWFY